MRWQSAATLVIAGAVSCSSPTRDSGDSAIQEPWLSSVPTPPIGSITPGQHALGLGQDRDGWIYVPPGYNPNHPAPLAVMLHGGHGHASSMEFFLPLADEFGVVVLAPESQNPLSWDRIFGSYGADVPFIDRALKYTFERCAIDPAHIALGGFSDGASYALSLGLANGDLFQQVMAFSPGFTSSERRGRPRVFVSHGIYDEVLSVVRTDSLVERLKANGYDVTYIRFDATHEVPPSVARAAFEWFVR